MIKKESEPFPDCWDGVINVDPDDKDEDPDEDNEIGDALGKGSGDGPDDGPGGGPGGFAAPEEAAPPMISA